MKVKQLKELLSKVDENLNVVIYDGDNELKYIKDASKSIFAGACDEEGNLLINGDDPEYNIDMFVIEI